MIEKLDAIPGIDKVLALAIIAEATVKHFLICVTRNVMNIWQWSIIGNEPS